MDSLPIIDKQKIYGLNRFLDGSKCMDFTSCETIETAQLLLHSIFPSINTDAPELIEIVKTLLSYASADGFQEGIEVGLSIDRIIDEGGE